MSGQLQRSVDAASASECPDSKPDTRSTSIYSPDEIQKIEDLIRTTTLCPACQGMLARLAKHLHASDTHSNWEQHHTSHGELLEAVHNGCPVCILLSRYSWSPPGRSGKSHTSHSRFRVQKSEFFNLSVGTWLGLGTASEQSGGQPLWFKSIPCKHGLSLSI